MARYNVLITVPDDLDVRLLDGEGHFLIGDDVMWELSELSAIWPALTTPGCTSDAPKKLIHAMVTTDAEDVQTYLEALIIAYSLGWVVVGILSHEQVEISEGVFDNKIVMPIDTVEVFKYIPDRDGETKDISWLHTRHYKNFKWRV